MILNVVYYLMLSLYAVSCLGLIVFVLLQKGKGTGFAGAFGVGAGSETVFGPRTSRSLPQRITYIMAGIFMVFSMVLSMMSGHVVRGSAPEKVEETAVVEEAAATDARVDALFSETAAPAPAAEAVTVVQTEPAPAPAVDGAAAPAEAPAAEAAPAEAAPAEAVPPAEAAPAADGAAAPPEAPAAAPVADEFSDVPAVGTTSRKQEL